MQPLALILILASAMVHAIWNTMLKQHASPHLAAIGISLSCGVSAVAFGFLTLHHPFPTSVSWQWSLAAGLFESGYFYTLGLAMEKAPLAVVYTLARGGAVVFVWPLAVVLSHEALTWEACLGAALVVVGLALTGYQKAKLDSSIGVLAALGSALCISLNHIAYKAAMNAGGQPSMVFAVSMLVVVVLSAAILGPSRIKTLAHQGVFTSRLVLVAGVLATIAFLLALAAMRDAGPGAVLTLRNLSIPFAVLLAWRLGERPLPRQLVGSLLVTMGAVLVSA